MVVTATRWRVRTRARALLVALILTLLLGSCGGGSKHSKSHAPAGSSSSAATNSSPSPSAAAFWPYTKLIRMLAGRTLVLPRGQVRLDPALLECNGQGSPLPGALRRSWARYTCTQTTFRGGVDRDVTFDVLILTGTQLKITAPRYGPE
jgi:hypothetical protein